MRKTDTGLDPLTGIFLEKHPDTCAAIPLSSCQKWYCLGLFILLLFLLKFLINQGN